MTGESVTRSVHPGNCVKWDICQSVDQVSAHDWNRCVPSDSPFLRHEFLSALENSGCVSEETGWLPQHIVIRKSNATNDQVSGLVPLYLKNHSWGEFIFDWDWSHAYQKHGIYYYPKLVSMSPFTGLTAPKLLASPDSDMDGIREQLADASIKVARESDLSSIHCLFLTQSDLDIFTSKGMIPRRSSITYIWTNRNYQSMEDFLATLSSRKRKKIRQERRSVLRQGIKVEAIQGTDMTPNHWLAFDEFYRSTTDKYGSVQYLNRRFFQLLAESMPENVVFFLATLDEKPVAGSLCYQGGGKLYGRYWGALKELPHLHFEACYYSAIEYCIREGFSHYNAGVQGEHKLSRGFLPEPAYSAHLFNHPQFSDAIRKYSVRESLHVQSYKDYLEQFSPYTSTPNTEN